MGLARSPQGTARLRLPSSSLRNLMVLWLVACPSSSGHPAAGLVMVRGTVPPVSSSLSPNRLRAQMERVSPVTGHCSDKHGRLTRETRDCGFVWRVLTAVARLASVKQHRPRRKDDRIGHQDDELPRGEPAHAAERQREAVPDEPEEQHADVLQVFPHRWRR